MMASFGVKCVRRVFILLWYLCKYLPGSGMEEEIWDLLLPCGVSEHEQASSSWPLQAPDSSLGVCLVLLQLGGGGNEHIGVLWIADDVSPRCMTEQVFWEKGHEERQGEVCYGIFWPQWRVTEPQWLLALKLLFPSLSSAVRYWWPLSPCPLSAPCLLALLALCKLWQPWQRVQAKKSAGQRKEMLLMPRYCVKCMYSLREGRRPVLHIPPSLPIWKQTQHSFPCHE